MKLNLPYICGYVTVLCAWATTPDRSLAEETPLIQRCEVIPHANHQVSFRIDGVERTCWHFGSEYPRPFFYPLNGPSGSSLTRMGHPGAANHDHHRSVWFAHHDIDGIDFWSDQTAGRVRQKQWYCYVDGDSESIMASSTGWYAQDGAECMEQQVIAAMIPMPDGEYALEFQITMRPPKGKETVVLGKTNFGFLAVRVAKTLSVHFGGGRISDSEKRKGERAIFGKQARWMDYSGPVAVGKGAGRRAVVEGITYFDHPNNPRYPTHWHVREDGWMGASFCMEAPMTLTQAKSLTLRYLLHVHGGPYDTEDAQDVHDAFSRRPGFRINKSTRPHQQHTVARSVQTD